VNLLRSSWIVSLNSFNFAEKPNLEHDVKNAKETISHIISLRILTATTSSVISLCTATKWGIFQIPLPRCHENDTQLNQTIKILMTASLSDIMSYRKNALRLTEFLTSIQIPISVKWSYVFFRCFYPKLKMASIFVSSRSPHRAGAEDYQIATTLLCPLWMCLILSSQIRSAVLSKMK